MMRRRNFVKSASAMTALGIVGTASAQESLTAEELRQKSREYLRAGEPDKSIQVFEDHGYPHTTTTSHPTVSQSDSELQTQSRYSESNSEFVISSGYAGGGDYHVQAKMKLDTRRGRIRNARNVDDVIGITFNGNHWSLSTPAPEITTAGSGGDAHDVDIHDYEPNQGVSATVDIAGNVSSYGGADEKYPDDAHIVLDTYLYNTDDHQSPVACEYEHTWAYPGAGAIDDISFQLDLDTLFLDIDLGSLTSTAWRDFDFADDF